MSLDNQEYYCCDWINSGLFFQISRLGFCCYGNESMGDHPTIFDDYYGELIDDSLIEKIRKFKQRYKDGDIPLGCKNCSLLEKRKWDGLEEDYFDHFMFSHSYKCNSKCIYCCTNEVADDLIDRTYDVYSVIKDLFDRGKIKASNRALAIFLGGEPTIFPDFEDLLNIFIDNNFKQLKVHSSGILCSKAVLKGLQTGVVTVAISPDAGSPEIYEKIKRVTCFDKVWDNIKTYIQNAQKPELVHVKYIIIPKINDNKEEIDLWFDKIIESGVKNIACDVEQNWFYDCKGKYPETMFELLDYFKEKSDSLSLNLEYYTASSRMLESRK